MLPKAGEPKGVPPRVLFRYGSLQVAGVMSALNLEYDLFSDSGVPLRAKASVTIKEQLPQFDAKLLGAGANTGSGATAIPPRRPRRRAAPGRPADRTGTALGGESAADFATRMGLDPSTWKTFAAGISDPLSLDAGLQIDFSSSVSASAGLGVQTGATAAGTGADPADAATAGRLAEPGRAHRGGRGERRPSPSRRSASPPPRRPRPGRRSRRPQPPAGAARPGAGPAAAGSASGGRSGASPVPAVQSRPQGDDLRLRGPAAAAHPAAEPGRRGPRA